jgi:hypothetical protein
MPEKINLIIQSFGQEKQYKRAILAILSFFAFSSGGRKDSRVLLFTDNPAYFSTSFRDLPVTYIPLSSERIAQLRGPMNFVHRIKIELIKESFERVKGNILWADSDTFSIADPVPLFNQLSPQKSFMHTPEYAFEELRNSSVVRSRDFLRVIESRTFRLASGRDIRVEPNLFSWNSGIMFLHREHAAFIRDVYVLTDQIFLACRCHTSEQYAFSIVLQLNTKVEACSQVFYHYWHSVMKQLMDSFLDQEMSGSWQGRSLDKKLEETKHWCAMLPSYLEKHWLLLREKAIEAFRENQYKEGYKRAWKAFWAGPFRDSSFIRDLASHTKRLITSKWTAKI